MHLFFSIRNKCIQWGQKKKYILTRKNSLYICTSSPIDPDVIQGRTTPIGGPGKTKTSFIHCWLDEDVFFFANYYILILLYGITDCRKVLITILKTYL
jgi:hypothetical protein